MECSKSVSLPPLQKKSDAVIFWHFQVKPLVRLRRRIMTGHPLLALSTSVSYVDLWSSRISLITSVYMWLMRIACKHYIPAALWVLSCYEFMCPAPLYSKGYVEGRRIMWLIIVNMQWLIVYGANCVQVVNPQRPSSRWRPINIWATVRSESQNLWGHILFWKLVHSAFFWTV